MSTPNPLPRLRLFMGITFVLIAGGCALLGTDNSKDKELSDTSPDTWGWASKGDACKETACRNKEIRRVRAIIDQGFYDARSDLLDFKEDRWRTRGIPLLKIALTAATAKFGYDLGKLSESSEVADQKARASKANTISNLAIIGTALGTLSVLFRPAEDASDRATLALRMQMSRSEIADCLNRRMERPMVHYGMGEARADMMRYYYAGTREIGENPSVVLTLGC